MKIRAVLQKAVVAMHRGRPADPQDRSWDRAVLMAEKALQAHPKIDECLELAELIRDLVDADPPGELTICPRTIAQPNHCVFYRQWRGPDSGSDTTEARANTLIECLRTIHAREH